MTAGLLLARRKMTGERTPVVVIPNIDLKKDSYIKIRQATMDALGNDFEDFVTTYDEAATEDMFSLEDVIHSVLLNNIGDVAYVSGVKVIYSNRVVNIRFLIAGIDTKIARCDYFSSHDYKAMYNGSEVSVRYEEFKTGEKSEDWEYTITI